MRADRIAQFLPQAYRAARQPASPLAALLDAMEDLHAPSERILEDLDAYLDPARTPDRFVPMLASWLDLTPYLDWSGGRPGAGAPRFAPGLDRLRRLIAAAPDLDARAGGRAALEGFLSTATGVSGYEIVENPPDASGAPRPFHVQVKAPAEARRYADLVARIVEGERPAYVTYEISYETAATTAGAEG